MGRFINTGIAHGTEGSPQLTIENAEYDDKVKTLDESNNFNSCNLSYEDSERKIIDYLLEKNHSVGGSKAKFFIDVLGFSKSTPKQFFDSISEAINEKKPYSVKITNYGKVLVFKEKIKAISGKYIYAKIVVSIQKIMGKILIG